jgi:hypothetical protein
VSGRSQVTTSRSWRCPCTSSSSSAVDLAVVTAWVEVSQGITWKIVVLQVRAVSQDGIINVQVQAWNIPR